jgi:hypothetical protein
MEGLGQLKKFNDLIRTRVNNVPAGSIVPQPTILDTGIYTIMKIIGIQNRDNYIWRVWEKTVTPTFAEFMMITIILMISVIYFFVWFI